MRKLSATTLALLALGLSTPTLADTLRMPAGTEQMEMDMPLRGTSMDQVRARFGAPQTIKTAVGQPPITRWVYAQYTVYFEHSHVIHSVTNHH